MTVTVITVRPELVEGLRFFSYGGSEGQGFDKLSPNVFADPPEVC
jgi:hypothetical protein